MKKKVNEMCIFCPFASISFSLFWEKHQMLKDGTLEEGCVYCIHGSISQCHLHFNTISHS